MCDVVHVLWLQRLEAQVLVLQHVAMTAAARGADVEIPDVADLLDEFDRLLSGESALSADSPEVAELKRVLGVS